MRLKIKILLCCCLLCTGCGKKEAPPELYSSATFLLDGSHLIPKIGAPTSTSFLALPSKEIPTTPPLALPGADSETYIIAQGKDITIGSPRSARILTHSTDSTSIAELLADSNAIYAIHFSGSLECYDRAGKLKWHSTATSLPKLGSLLFQSQLILATDTDIRAFNCNDGSVRWKYTTSLAPVSLCIDWKNKLIVAAVSANDATSTDSILCIKADGQLASRIGFAKTRITSNLCVIGDGGIAFGYLSGADTSATRRTAHLCVWTSITSAPKLHWQHPLPYIVSSVSFTGSIVIGGGFRETEGEIISGIDAFHSEDSATVWKRRFTYPLVSTVTVSSSYAYIPFTFSSEAMVPTKTVVSIIDLSDGKTHSELNVADAATGFVQGIGMPVEGMLVYADRSLPRLYFLKP